MAKPELAQFIDPICSMHVAPEEAPAVASYNGHSYYFCSDTHRDECLRDPETYVKLRESEQTQQ